MGDDAPRVSIGVVALVNIVGGLIFGWIAIGSNTAAGLFWPCMYNQHDSYVKSALQAMVNVGAAVGSITGGKVIERTGHPNTIKVGSLITLLATIWTCAAFKYWEQTVARIFAGLGIGFISSAAPEYVTKSSTKLFNAQAGTLGCLFQVAVTIGILLSNIAGYFLLGSHRDDDETGSWSEVEGAPDEYTKGYCDENDVGWFKHQNAYLFIPGVVLCLLNVGLGFLMPVAPWESDGTEETDKLNTQEPDAKPDTPTRTWILGFMSCVALQLTGINAVMFYSGKFFDAAHYKHKVLGSVLVMAWNFVSTLFALYLVERLGRRQLMLVALGMIAVSITALAPLDVYIKDDSVKAIMCFVCLAVYILGFEMGPGCLFWVILNEIAPKGSPMFFLANSCQWIFTLIVTFIFPGLQDATGGWVFWFFAVPAILSWIFHIFCLPETKDVGNNKARAQQLMEGVDQDGQKIPWNVLSMSAYDDGANEVERVADGGAAHDLAS